MPRQALKSLFSHKTPRSFAFNPVLILSLKALVLLSALLAAAGAAFFFSSSSGQKPPPIKFLDNGVLQIKNTESFNSIKLYEDPDGAPFEIKTFGQPLIQIPFSWKPQTTYKVSVDGQPSVSALSPKRPPELAVRLHAPLGQKPFQLFFSQLYSLPKPTEISLPVSANEQVRLMVETEKLADKGEINFSLSAYFSDNEKKAGQNKLEFNLLNTEGQSENNNEVKLSFEFDKKIWTAEIKIGSSPPKTPLNIVLKGQTVNIPLKIRFVNKPINPKEIIVLDWKIPVNETGAHPPHYKADQIAIPNQTWSLIAHWLNIKPMSENYLKPFTFQSVKVKNTSSRAVNLTLESKATDGFGSDALKYFKTPDFQFNGGRDTIVGLSEIPAGEVKNVIIPFYLSPETPSGSYLREIKITSLGSGRVLKVVQKPLSIIRSDSGHSLWLTIAAALAFFWTGLIIVFYRRLAMSFGTRTLVLLSLLGSVQFCLSLVGGIISNIFFALLGPFNCLIGGLFSEVLNYLVISSILFLVPRTGAMTVTGLITYLMGGIMFGSFGLTDFIYMGSTIVFREFFLFIAGVTKIRPDPEKIPSVWLMAAALGVADALSKYTSLILQAVFYRLFFADWYFVLQVAVAGFLYTALGVFLGQFSGKNLRRARL